MTITLTANDIQVLLTVFTHLKTLVFMAVIGYALAGFVWFLHFIIQEGGIFEGYGSWLERNKNRLGRYLHAWLGGCPYCYGTIMAIFTYGYCLHVFDIQPEWHSALFGLWLFVGYVHSMIDKQNT